VEGRRVRKELVEMSRKHPRYGYRRITALLRREGFEVNPKRVARIRREEGLKVSKRQRKTRRLGLSTAERLKAEKPRQVWSWDFVEDQTENGSRFRILTLIDEYTRECPGNPCRMEYPGRGCHHGGGGGHRPVWGT